MSLKRLGLLLLLMPILSACDMLRFVPQDKWLLDKARVEVTDTKAERPEELRQYLHQKQNAEIFGFWKLQLGIYSTAKPDSSKWINRALWRMGEEPEVFDPALADYSKLQLERAMFNRGYFHATIDTTMQVKKRRLRLTYEVTAGEPYMVRNYKVNLAQRELRSIAADTKHALVQPGMQYNADKMNAERGRIAEAMQRRGYYYFDRDYLQFIADSAVGNRQVDLQLCLQDYVVNAEDSLRDMLFRKYVIRDVRFYTDFDPHLIPDGVEVHEETEPGYLFAYTAVAGATTGHRLLRNQVLKKTCVIKPGQVYSITRVERSYAALNALGPIKYVEISFEQVSDHELSCCIVLSRSKLNSVSAEVEGTFSAGDWGVSGGVGYVNRNLFHGAEELSINGKAGYEWRQNGGRGVEAKGEVALRFTRAPKIGLSYQYQHRPDEFTRTIAQAGLSYSFTPYLSRWQHQFDFLDISYVYLPWISDAFSQYFLQSTNLLKYSYEDHFIMDWRYSGIYSSYRKNQPLRSYVTFNYSVETAGNLLYGISKVFDLPRTEEDDAYQLGGVRFSQYAKGDVGLTFHNIFNAKHRMVYHAGLGVAIPYGNASAIPFEKRYFAGGANSVRGWEMRTLGPGGYRGNGTRNDYSNQAGDIKLDLNVEYRWKVWSMIELAAFTDAGNIWTVRDYESQPHGLFRWDEFYRQIAWSYGAGVRLDFSFFIFRLDLGVKLYDPSRLYYDQKQWRTASNGLNWKDDMTLHFAIGYPF